METISCHSNQSSYLNVIINISFVEGNVLCKPAKFQLHPLNTGSEKNFEYIFENLPFMSPRQPIKSSDLDKSRMKHGGLLNKHFCKKKLNGRNCQFPLFPLYFHFSHYKSMEILSCHSNQSSYPTKIKNITFVEGNVLSKYAKFRLHPPYGF